MLIACPNLIVFHFVYHQVVVFFIYPYLIHFQMKRAISIAIEIWTIDNNICYWIYCLFTNILGTDYHLTIIYSQSFSTKRQNKLQNCFWFDNHVHSNRGFIISRCKNWVPFFNKIICTLNMLKFVYVCSNCNISTVSLFHPMALEVLHYHFQF